MIEPDVCERAAALGLVDVVIVDLRHGPWRGGLQDMLGELLRRSRARPDGGMQAHVVPVRTLDEAAELIDELGHRLLAGETVVCLCDPIDADLVEHHARIYATLPAH
jgi:hypothetical protein